MHKINNLLGGKFMSATTAYSKEGSTEPAIINRPIYIGHNGVPDEDGRHICIRCDQSSRFGQDLFEFNNEDCPEPSLQPS
jgi:hypothetical protein